MDDDLIPFHVPKVPTNSLSWGPPTPSKNTSNDEETKEEVDDAFQTKFDLLPYAPFGRSDRLGRVADFTNMSSSGIAGGGYGFGSGQTSGPGGRTRRYDHTSGSNNDFQYQEKADDFELVDTSKSTSQKRFGGGGGGMHKKRQQQSRLRQLNAHRNDSGGGRQSYHQRTRGGGRGGRGGGYHRYGGRGGRFNWRDRVDRTPSVSIKPDWTLVADMDLNKISKGIINTSKPSKEEDLLWCGNLERYNDAYDKCSTRNVAGLKRSENKEFYYVTTTDDPLIERLAIEEQGTVFATDAILAHLMTCPRSVFPWDIVVQKLPSGAIFFDKRNDSKFDYLSVSETAHNPPSATKSDDDPDGINTQERLMFEATMINQNFSQQILKSSGAGKKTFPIPNPFHDDDDAGDPASVAYRYRRFNLGDGIELVCRCELHGITSKKGGSDEYITTFALNEYFDSTSGQNNKSGGNFPNNNNVVWREKIDTSRGTVLATELKNNAFKLAKWTAQSLLANADQMKIGFVSRSSPKNPTEHVILATQSYRPKEFAAQITLNEGNMWGIMRILIQTFKDQPEGKYVLMRDPNKSALKVFNVPDDTFESEDEDSD